MHDVCTGQPWCRPWILAGAIAAVTAGYLTWHGAPAGVPVVWREPDEATLPVGSMAPDFELSTVDSLVVQLSALRGKPGGVVFVRAACPHCAAMQRELVKSGLNESAGLLIVTRSVTEAQQLKETYSSPFPVLVDTVGSVFRQYNVAGVPIVYLLDAEGMIESVNKGWPSSWIERLRQAQR